MTEHSGERGGKRETERLASRRTPAPTPRSASWRSPTPFALLLVVAAASPLGLGGRPEPGGQTATRARPPVDFTREVRPILSGHCFACHGPDAESREGGLSLVDPESAIAGGRSGRPAIVPGAPDQSELWRRVVDPLDPMPPLEAHAPLSRDQKEILHRWISEGADYAPHWAYETPERRPDLELPPGRDPVDVLLERRWRELGVRPSPPTDQVTLLRRLFLDLNGLPPHPGDIDRHLDAPDALPELVDALLASPRFGERLAVLWLDLVRYADTVGYHGDQEHQVWPYRDWVIAAFNRGMPFDRFTRLQLAGDLVAEESPELDPDARQDALVASGYNRLLQTSHEGGLQLAEYRAIYMADRVRNASDVWLGGTLGCAQCHDHKYDPYTHVDFHTFGAFFADIDDETHLRDPYAGYNTTPTRREPEMRVVSREQRERLQELNDRRLVIDDRIDGLLKSLGRADPVWERSILARREDSGNRRIAWIDDRLDTGGTVSGDWRFQRDDRVAPHSGETYRIQGGDGLVQHYTVGTTRRITVEPDSHLEAWIHLDPENPPR
ncbi:MAG: DUF1549 domain-containing protein, partial [Planctomycetota bacterium]|nr:DUF1549 domain-containing protein [Planctomycetota bacterium]